MGIENPVHLLFVAVIALIVLGPRRLPQLARSLGRGVREFRQAVSGETPEDPVPPAGAASDLSPPDPIATPAPPPSG